MTREDVVMELVREDDAESLARACAQIAARLAFAAGFTSERVLMLHALDTMRDALQMRVAMESI